MGYITNEQIASVKALGFLHDKRTEDKFNCRVITRNGKITTKEAKAIADAAEIYGSGEIAMTSRMSIEIQGVPYENINPLIKYLSDFGIETGGTGPKVRPVVSCKGTTCQYGLIDTFALSEMIHERFYRGYHEVKLPHKFKIAVGGCPNNCVKPDINDLGIIGQCVPAVDVDRCRGCNPCSVQNVCPMKAFNTSDGKASVDKTVCINCGRCVNKCPFDAVEASVNGYRLYIGGRWGKKVGRGIPLDKIFTSDAEVLDTIEKIILLYKEQGIAGERFAETIERLGFENVQNQI